MKTKLLTLLTVFFAASILVACHKKDDEQPYPNTITVDGAEQKINSVTYGSMQYTVPGQEGMSDKMGFRLSTAASRKAFDSTKDFDIYLEIDTKYMSKLGTDAGNAKVVKLRAKNLYFSNEAINQGLASTGSIIIIMGSYGQAEIRLNIVIRNQETGGSSIIAHRVQCRFKGQMEHAASFGGI